MAHESRPREDLANLPWSTTRPYFRHADHDLQPLPADNGRPGRHDLPSALQYPHHRQDMHELPHRSLPALDGPNRLPPPSHSPHIPTGDRRLSVSNTQWDRHRPPSPPPSAVPPYSRSDLPPPRVTGHYGPSRHTWEEPRTPSELSASHREAPGYYPPPQDYREPVAGHGRHAYPPPSPLPPPSPGRSSHLPSAVTTWTPNDHSWSDPRDRRTPLTSPVDWDRRKSSQWVDDRAADIPSPHHAARPWERDFREPHGQRLPPVDPVVDARWRREQDPYAPPPSRVLPDPMGGFRPPSATLTPRGGAYERSFDSAGPYNSPATLPPPHPFHDRPSSSSQRLGPGFPPPLTDSTYGRPAHGRTRSGAFAIDDPHFSDGPRLRVASENTRDLREIKREPEEDMKAYPPPVSKHSTGSSHANMGPTLPPLPPRAPNGFAPSPSSRPDYPAASPRYQLPPLNQHNFNRSITPAQPFANPLAASPSAQALHTPRSFSPRITTPQQGPSPSALPHPRWSGERVPSPSRREPAVVHRLEEAAPAVQPLAPADDAMEVDVAQQPLQRMETEVIAPPAPVIDRPDAEPFPLANEQPVEEAITRQASEEEVAQRVPRRSKRRGPTRHRRGANADPDDMEVDQEPMNYANPWDQVVAPIPDVYKYLQANQRFEDSVMDVVEEVLAKNHALADPPSSRQRTAADDLVDEIARSTETEAVVQAYCDATRDLLVSRVKQGTQEVGAKVQMLRDQYRVLNNKWQARCAVLDRQANAEHTKTPVPATPTVETPQFAAPPSFTSGRATRRTAGNQVSDAVRSDLEFEQVMASLGNEDLVDPNVLSIRNAASIPDMLSVLPRPSPLLDVTFDDNNGIVAFPQQFYDIATSLGDWTDVEKNIFLEQFGINGKQFGKIADHLPHKTAEQCVLYYYISKKTIADYRDIGLKGLKGRKKKAGRRNFGPALGKQKGNALLTDIQKTRGEDTPADSPSGSPKDADAELGGSRRGRRPAQNGTPSLGDDGPRTRPMRATRARRTLGGSPSDGETRNSGDEGSSSDNSEEEVPDGRRGKSRRTRKPTHAPDGTTNVPPAKKKPRASSHWSTAEKAGFKDNLEKFGKNWEKISAAIRTKSATQCRNFWNSNREDLDLESILAIYEANHQGEEPEDEGPGESEPANGTPAGRYHGPVARVGANGQLGASNGPPAYMPFTPQYSQSNGATPNGHYETSVYYANEKFQYPQQPSPPLTNGNHANNGTPAPVAPYNFGPYSTPPLQSLPPFGSKPNPVSNRSQPPTPLAMEVGKD